MIVDLKDQLRLKVVDESFKELFKYKEEQKRLALLNQIETALEYKSGITDPQRHAAVQERTTFVKKAIRHKK